MCGVRACVVVGYMLQTSCIVHVMAEEIDPNQLIVSGISALSKLC